MLLIYVYINTFIKILKDILSIIYLKDIFIWERIRDPIFTGQNKVYAGNYKYTYHCSHVTLFLHIIPIPVQTYILLQY